MHEGQWFLSNPVGFRWVYDCSNIEIVEGVIPEGANLSRNFGDSAKNTRR